MPSVYDLKPKFQALLRPIVRQLADAGVTANQVTVFACLVSVVLGLDLAYGSRRWLALPVWLFFRMALNAIDGMLAREHGQASKLGALLNELTDVIADAFLLLPFVYVPGWNPLITGFVIFLSGLTEMTSVVGQSITGVRRNDGPMGKSDRALWLSVIAVWIYFDWPHHELFAPLLALVLVATVYNRARHILKGE
ncbi:MAG: CDP-alcohol phosphatidyltransferase family protein [Acidobacteria bacterium]|nr:CDP-alcohol phosphatidyltransferase family protein [Acidobacteriota bacterium]